MSDGNDSGVRVASLIASGTEIVAALGMGGSLVGRSHSCDYPSWVPRLPALTRPKIDPEAPSGEIDAAIRGLVEGNHRAYEIDAGELGRLRPDVIVTQDECEYCAGSLSDVKEALSYLALPDVELCTLAPRILPDVRRDFLKVADALGIPERGEALRDRFDARLRQVRDRTRRLQRRSLVMIEWLDPPMVAGGWMPELARIAGGEPLLVDDGESRALGWEAVAAADPDHVVVLPCGFSLQRTLSELGSPGIHDGLGRIAAVREGRCTILDGKSYLNRPGPRLAASAELLAAALRPSAHADLAATYAPAMVTGWSPP